MARLCGLIVSPKCIFRVEVFYPVVDGCQYIFDIDLSRPLGWTRWSLEKADGCFKPETRIVSFSQRY